ncbi:peptidase [Peptostreptococcus russellii]|uniref:Peptidase n=1 Tax=Peptostreptococcus russellii TaxID=215200 RepID=A0A2P7Q1B9_9FIRM|nr:site-2 protease family protein [Peptostreptococcus russellii]PSJ31754.1 peptidase [Peptostreptococcus russellii]
MSFEFLNSVSDFLITLLAILFAISVHEFGHAFVAHLNGDNTAKNAGRMTINPINHIDPFGMLMMFLVRFGWAKPVPVNPNNYKSEKIGNITVSLAGIVFNLLSAIVFALVNKYVAMESIKAVSYALVMYNIGFAAFNILPIPPLDGWNLIATFLPRETVYKVYEYSRYTTIIFIILIMTNAFSYILNPIYMFFYRIVMLFL